MGHRLMQSDPCTENTLRIIEVNTYRMDAGIIDGGMDRKEVMAARLREAREKAGYSTIASAAQAFGWNPVTYTSHENGTRRYDIDAAVRYGKALKVNPGHLLGLDTIDTPAFRIATEPASKMVSVVGAVEAGVWRERTEWAREQQYEVEAGYSMVSGAERFALEVEGYSMDKIFPPGSVLDCLRVYKGRLDPQDGDLVIVQRRRHDLMETTCKRLTRDGETWVLIAESTKPEFAEPIVLGTPDRDFAGDDDIEVIGIVARAIQAHYQHRKRS